MTGCMPITTFFRIITEVTSHFKGKRLPKRLLFITRSCHYYEVAEGKEPPVLFPAVYLKKGINSEDEIYFSFRFSFLNLINRINRVRKPAPFHLHIRKVKVRVPLNGDPCHLYPLLRRLHFLLTRVRRKCGWNEQKFVKRKSLPHLLPSTQVAEVYRIKCTTEYSDLHALICPSPNTIYFVVVKSSSPIGPKEWIFVVLIPISAPRPSCPPSLNLVDAFTNKIGRAHV